MSSLGNEPTFGPVLLAKVQLYLLPNAPVLPCPPWDSGFLLYLVVNSLNSRASSPPSEEIPLGFCPISSKSRALHVVVSLVFSSLCLIDPTKAPVPIASSYQPKTCPSTMQLVALKCYYYAPFDSTPCSKEQSQLRQSPPSFFGMALVSFPSPFLVLVRQPHLEERPASAGIPPQEFLRSGIAPPQSTHFWESELEKLGGFQTPL